jgi:hypothetical protein
LWPTFARRSGRTTGGGILIESKEDIKERIGRSPDAGDAVVLAYYGVKQRKNSAVGMFAR